MKIFNIEDTVAFEKKIIVIFGDGKEVSDYVHQTYGYDVPVSGYECGMNLFHKTREDIVMILLDEVAKDGIKPIIALVHELEHLDTNFRDKFKQNLKNFDEYYVRWWTWLICNTDMSKAIEYAVSLSEDQNQP